MVTEVRMQTFKKDIVHTTEKDSTRRKVGSWQPDGSKACLRSFYFLQIIPEASQHQRKKATDW